jgi:hypothetical protein
MVQTAGVGYGVLLNPVCVVEQGHFGSAGDGPGWIGYPATDASAARLRECRGARTEDEDTNAETFLRNRISCGATLHEPPPETSETLKTCKRRNAV